MLLLPKITFNQETFRILFNSFYLYYRLGVIEGGTMGSQTP